MGYLFLIITILTETAAVICIKLSNGFQQKLYATFAFVLYAATFIFLTLSLKRMPASIANAIWSGASTLLVVVIGVFFLNEKLSLLQVLSVLLIVAGLIGLNLQSV